MSNIPSNYITEQNLEYMAHIYLIYDMNAPRGIEETYCSIYETSGKNHNYSLLYTDNKNHCTEIVCTPNNLQNILEFTFLIFKKYWRTRT